MIAGRSFTVTFPTGVKVKNSVANFAYWSDDNGDEWDSINVVISGDYTVDITIPSGVSNAVDMIQLRPIVDIDGFSGGDIEVTVDAFDSGITGGKFILGRVGTGDTTASVISVPTIGESGTAGTIRIVENSVGAIGDSKQEIVIKLPAGFEWGTMDASKISFMAGLSSSTITQDNKYNQGAGKDDIYTDGRTFRFYFDPVNSRQQRGIIQIVPVISATDDADYGDVEVNLSGDKIDDADLVIAKYADFGVTVKADGDPKEVLAGLFGRELQKLYFKENVDGSFIPNRKTKIEFPSWVKITGVDVSEVKNISDLNPDDKKGAESSFKDSIKVDGTSNEVQFTVPDGPGKTEFKLKFTVSIKGNASGDIVAKVTGRGGVEGEVVLGKALTPVSVKTDIKDVKVGVKNQPIGDIVVTEAKKEALAKGTLVIKLGDGVEWSDTPDVEVVEGNIDLDTEGIDADGSDLYIPIKSTSTKISTIKISGGKVDLDRTIPEGKVGIAVQGSAVVVNNKAAKGYDGTGNESDLDPGEFDQDSCIKVPVANVVTPAPGEQKATVVFTINDTKYMVNGVEKEMDAAPYIKNDRTYVPVRYAAEACGVTSDNIMYADGKVTLIKGDKVVQLIIGSNVMLINGIAINMDVAPEIVDPGRTMLPFRWVAQALGAKVDWNPDTQTVTMEL
ncbi:MAG: copper amine oxidase N-terminal domain-containing protein [Armatimonadetes bacterium]|nr:copper amine oxidase N-terminal domain-containing protein [Armatimonadota bacterium]